MHKVGDSEVPFKLLVSKDMSRLYGSCWRKELKSVPLAELMVTLFRLLLQEDMLMS